MREKLETKIIEFLGKKHKNHFNLNPYSVVKAQKAFYSNEAQNTHIGTKWKEFFNT